MIEEHFLMVRSILVLGQCFILHKKDESVTEKMPSFFDKLTWFITKKS